jgi:hypothetical protein
VLRPDVYGAPPVTVWRRLAAWSRRQRQVREGR